MDGHDSAHVEGRSVCLDSGQSRRSLLSSSRWRPPLIKTPSNSTSVPQSDPRIVGFRRTYRRLSPMSTAEVAEVTAAPVEPPAAEAPAEVPPEPKPAAEEKPAKGKRTRTPKAPKEKKPKAPKPPAPSHPPYFQMIKEAIMAFNEKTGSSSYAIAKHMEEKHKGVLPANYKKVLAIQLRNFTAKGKLVKVKASFKLAESGKEEKKNKKPAKKALSAPAKRKAPVLAAPKKSSKPSKAKKKPGVKKAKKATPAKPKQPKSIKSPAAKKAKKATA